MKTKKPRLKKPRLINIGFYENSLVSSAFAGIVFGIGFIVYGAYENDMHFIEIGGIISAISICGMIYSQYKIDKARDRLERYLESLRQLGLFVGDPKKAKFEKGMHAFEMERKAKELEEQWLKEKSGNKKLLKNEEEYKKRALMQLSLMERKKLENDESL